MMLLSALFCLFAAEQPDNSAAGDSQAKAVEFAGAMELLCHPPNASSFDRAQSTLQSVAIANQAVIGDYLKQHAAYYLGKQSEKEIERDDLCKARAAAWVTGSAKLKDVLRPYVTENSPSCVLFAYAEACGVKLYYNLVEGAAFDQIVDGNQAREILKANRLWPETEK